MVRSRSATPRPIDVRTSAASRHLLLGGRRRARRPRPRVLRMATLLDALGDERPRALLLTHIHFDHAGATGALVRRWPDLPVYVHERGAPHLIDPARLRRQRGTALRRGAWSGCGARSCRSPEANLRVLEGGETGSRAPSASSTRPATPPTTSPTCTRTPAAAFVGDIGGRARPADAAHARARRRRPTSTSTPGTLARPRRGLGARSGLGLTHFGAVEDAARAARRGARDAARAGRGCAARARPARASSRRCTGRRPRARRRDGADAAILQACPPRPALARPRRAGGRKSRPQVS